MNHIDYLKERLELLEHHIEERHKQAQHERKTLLQHVRAARRQLEQLANEQPEELPEFFVRPKRKVHR
ncbi:MAG TPA: hypothetical protein VLN59_17325 [Burkholderiales bacterium]|nr:hypothetical protein [Burkholderiales bacterium]